MSLQFVTDVCLHRARLPKEYPSKAASMGMHYMVSISAEYHTNVSAILAAHHEQVVVEVEVGI